NSPSSVALPSLKVVPLAPTVIVPDDRVAVIQNPLAPAPEPEPAPESESGSGSGIAAGAAPPVADRSLNFSFRQPAWVEVRDASGKIVFSQLNQAGTQRIVAGQPPYTLVVGNASQVALQYKGAAVDLSKSSKDDVARLTLE
ncbi:MAG: DUF4115 domain-containing protein, partial [Propionivibrio sp.]